MLLIWAVSSTGGAKAEMAESKEACSFFSPSMANEGLNQFCIFLSAQLSKKLFPHQQCVFCALRAYKCSAFKIIAWQSGGA